MTYGYPDIEAGLATLWPVRYQVTHPGGPMDQEEGVYHIEGDEHWVMEDDCNDYATSRSPEVARRIVAAWNASIGVSTDELEARAVAHNATGAARGIEG